MTREEEILKREQASIARKRAENGARRLSPWQLKAAYYLAHLNNLARQTGGAPVTIVLTPGKNPKLEKVETNGK